MDNRLRGYFSTYLLLGSTQSVTLANQQTRCRILGKGTVIATTIVNGKKVEIRLQNVLHIPGIRKRFISTRHLDQKGFSIEHRDAKAVIKKIATGQTCGIGRLHTEHDNEYYLSLSLAPPPTVASVSYEPSIEIIHQRLGHLGWSTLRQVVLSPSKSEPHKLSTCDGCQLGKQTR